MTLTLVNCRMPDVPAELDAIGLAQLREVGRLFDGEDRAPELRLIDVASPTDDEGEAVDDGNLAARMLSVWEAHDGAAHRYDLWLHHGDSGCLFAKGTTEVRAVRSQFAWVTPDLAAPSELATAIDAAMDAVKGM